MKAAGYIRVSTSSQVDTGESMSTQRKKIEAYCAPTLKSWELVKIYEDAGISGAKDDRPGLQSLLKAAANHEFDVVIVQDLSRFGRNTLHLKQNIELLKNNDISFVSIDNGIDGASSPIGDLLVNILSAIYEFERATIIARTTENRQIRWDEKRIFVGHVPFGYRWDKLTQRVEIHDEEAATYRHIVSQYLDFKKSLATIADELQTPTRRVGNTWVPPVIGRILKNETYYTGRITTKAKKGEIVYDCPRIITHARWLRIQEQVKANSSTPGPKSSRISEFLLYGLLQCGVCGSTLLSMYESRPRANGEKWRNYACHWHTVSTK